jgi:hypothetical protein
MITSILISPKKLKGNLTTGAMISSLSTSGMHPNTRIEYKRQLKRAREFICLAIQKDKGIARLSAQRQEDSRSVQEA